MVFNKEEEGKGVESRSWRDSVRWAKRVVHLAQGRGLTLGTQVVGETGQIMYFVLLRPGLNM
jgi:hypothetical protein